MALTAASTYADAIGQLNNNLAWDADPTKAANYLEAARWLFFNRARFSMKAGSQLNFEVIQKEIDPAGPLAKFVAASKASAQRTNWVRGRPV